MEEILIAFLVDIKLMVLLLMCTELKFDSLFPDVTFGTDVLGQLMNNITGVVPANLVVRDERTERRAWTKKKTSILF